MSYHIIHEKALAGTYGEAAPGVSVIVRISCSPSLQINEALLREVVPAHGRITPTLLAYHDGSAEGDAIYDGFDASILVKIEVRQGEEHSASATERYLDLLLRLLDALPDQYSTIEDVLVNVTDWSKELNPNRLRPRIG